MNSLVTVRSTTYYRDNGGDRPHEKLHELVFVIGGTKYYYSNEEQVISERKLNPFRCVVNDKGLRSLIEAFEKILDDE